MSQLNDAQRAAVDHGSGPLLILAGAGSGKTRVIIQRIGRLIERGVPPSSILAVSFTNKAAGEMTQRLAPLVGDDAAQEIWLSTFHSFGVRFLTEESKALGRGGRFVIFDQGDSIGLVRDLLHREHDGRRLDAAAVLARISLWKNRFLSPDEAPDGDSEYDAAARDVYPAYERALRSMRAVDFDDLVVAPVRILQKHEDIRAKWRERFTHLLVDEFQDTNPSQLELVRLIGGEDGNVCVVGDDDQSIYGWRGAEVTNVLHFDRHFPSARIIKLEDNYRSREQVLHVANSIISAAEQQRRHPKTLRAVRGQGAPVQLWITPDEIAEAKAVAQEIRRLTTETRVPSGEIGILYRSATQARPVEEELRVEGIQYRVYGGTQLFDRKEIKDAIAYLRVVVNPRDELSLRRILNNPPRGIGETTVERIAEHARRQRMAFARALADIDSVDDIPTSARHGAHNLASALDRARGRFRKGDGLAAAARDLFVEVGLQRELTRGEGDQQKSRRWDNIEFLLRSLARYEERTDAGKPTISQFLTRLTLRTDQDAPEPEDRVTLSTLHAAKGLEFDAVFLLGCVEGRLPHARTLDPKATEAAPTGVDEERRLFYVGVTRARDHLYLLRHDKRTLRGRATDAAASRFLEGLPEQAIESKHVDANAPLDNAELADMAGALLERLRS